MMALISSTSCKCRRRDAVEREAQPLDRGRSRGGTRGGKPSTSSQDTAGLGSLNTDSLPNLDREIEACDGSEATTQTMLGELISRPKLTEKLLSKPPFRFLHDIVTEVTRVTGFSRGIFTDEEMDSANVQEKEKKVLYLEKLIKLIGVHLNTVVEARPAKIVAGLEAQNTNVLLQLLAVAAKHRPDSSRSVVLALDQLNLPIPSSLSAANESSRTASKEAPRTASSEPREEKARPSESARSRDERNVEEAHAEEKRVREEVPRAETKEEIEGAPNSGSAADAEAKRSLRPTTARRRPPKVAQGAKEVSVQETVVAKKTEGLIVDGQADDDDDDIPDETVGSRLGDDVRAESKGDDSNPQSKLVKDIMSRQAEQEAQSRKADDQTKSEQEEAKSSSGIRLGRLKKTGTDKKGAVSGPGDMEKLRSTIQQLVQHTGPLGNCMDFIQEDVGVMTSEMRKWEEDCVRYETRLEEERQRTQAILKPLNSELLEITEQVITATPASAVLFHGLGERTNGAHFFLEGLDCKKGGAYSSEFEADNISMIHAVVISGAAECP